MIKKHVDQSSRSRDKSEWRQGLKHDCSGIMELTKRNNWYENSSGDAVFLEEDLVYPLLKSSDLKRPVIDATRKQVIVPQKFVGQNTLSMKKDFPKTFSYLEKNGKAFERRKSSIYRNKPPFSIFGIGDYSFLPYKVAISGLYKQTAFSLILPVEGKPVMLDDTCYFVGLDSLPEAVCCLFLLNHPKMQELLSALIFWEGKRVITKDILMRLDYARLAGTLDRDSLFEYSVRSGIDCEKKSLQKKWEELNENNDKSRRFLFD